MIRRRIAIAVSVALLAVGVGVFAPATARAVTVNGCTVNGSSVSLLPKPNYSQKPGVGFHINCQTLTQWTVKTQCQVNYGTGNGYVQCANTDAVTINGFNSGGDYVVLVGNGSWGCNNSYTYRGVVYMGGGSAIGSQEVPQPAWNC